MSAKWFLVSMYLIWILELKLVRSTSQSRATLWVLEKCLIVGLDIHLDHYFVLFKLKQQSFCGRVHFGWPISSAEVRGLVIHDIKDEEGVKQKSRKTREMKRKEMK